MAGKTLPAGKLRHRVIIERPYYSQNNDTGDMTPSWEQFATLWAAIEPLSGREFVAARAEESEIIGRITIRFRDDITADMRIYHPATGQTYDIKAVLPDLASNRKYLTLPVSEGIRIINTVGEICFNVVDGDDDVLFGDQQVIYCYTPEIFNVLDGGDLVKSGEKQVIYST